MIPQRASGGVSGGRGPARLRRTAVIVTIGRPDLGRPIGPGFVGLSLETWTAGAYAGSNPRAVNAVFVRLIRNLVPGQTPVLRIGGDSTDWSWWPGEQNPAPPWVKFTLSPGWVASIRALAIATSARLILGINLEADSIQIAAAEAHAVIAGIGRQHIEALEIGNEPEDYTVFPFYRTSSGARVWGRPPGYDPRSYAKEFLRYVAALPRITVAGPATGNSQWLSQTARLLTPKANVKVLTFHAYGLGCTHDPGSPRYPTIAHLLAPFASRELLRGVTPAIAIAHGHNISFRIDELNSVGCGGERGVSDTFASALWVLDALFEAAHLGVDAVNIHTHDGTVSKLFTFDRQPDGTWLGSVHPEYYGVLMFARAAPSGSRLLQITPPSVGQIRTWATLAPDGQIRVVLINDSLARSRTVLVRTPVAAGPATLERLRAPSVHATSGVTLAGQSFGSQTASGTLDGAVSTSRVRPIAGEYAVRLPPVSAAMLTVPA